MITSPKDERFAGAVRGYGFATGRRVERTYGAREESYDLVEDCGHVWTCDGTGNSVCEHCGTLEDFDRSEPVTLAAKIQADRHAKVAAQMRDDELHGRSLHPDIEDDGADAKAHGYPEDSCPYANTAAMDLSGRVAPIGQDQITKAAAWRRGWRAAR